jgi:hypothetical protein
VGLVLARLFARSPAYMDYTRTRIF